MEDRVFVDLSILANVSHSYHLPSDQLVVANERKAASRDLVSGER